ncbi:MAG TPA: type II secretion system F family protein [Symbiobacteriaceae bacterium]
MALYHYRARNATTGRLVLGSVEAASSVDLIEQLKQSGYVPLDVRVDSRSWWRQWVRRDRGPLGPRDLAAFYRQLATMVKSGLPVVTALEVLSSQERGRIREVAAAVNGQILRGSSLADAMANMGPAFPPVQIELIRSGEMSGYLDKVLERLAVIEEKELSLRSRVRSATLYPMVVFLVACGVLAFMMLVVLPTFMGIFEELNAELPMITRMVMAVVGAIRRWWMLVLLLIVALVIGYRRWVATPQGRRAVDSLKLRVPVFGALHSQLLLGSMARNISMLLSSGLTLIPVLQATARVMGNSVFRRALTEVSQGVTQGATLADSMRWTGVIPDFFVEMVQVGERTGALDEVLNKVAEHYDRQVEEMVSNLSTLLEPFLLLLVGGIVALVLVSLFLPIVSLLNAVDTAF